MRPRVFVVSYLWALSPFLNFAGGESKCGLEFSPPKAVVEFSRSVSVNCSSSVLYDDIGWEVSDGNSNKHGSSLATWTVSKLSQWDVKPMCYRMKHGEPCSEDYSFIVYKTPNSVSIRASHAGAMMEGNQYELQCDIQDVAPVQFLTVKWYKGQKVVNVTSFTDTIKTPVNQAATIVIRPDRDDDGAQYRCEAELLAEELQTPLNISSKPLYFDVHYPPKHHSTTEIIRDNNALLNCTVSANPPAKYLWKSEHLEEENTSSWLMSSTLTSGRYTCIATNSRGTDQKLFIIEKTDRTTFWALLGSGLALGAVIIISYAVYKWRTSTNSVI